MVAEMDRMGLLAPLPGNSLGQCMPLYLIDNNSTPTERVALLLLEGDEWITAGFTAISEFLVVVDVR